MIRASETTWNISVILGTPSRISRTLRSSMPPNGVSDIKTVEEITMKKPRTVVDPLAVTDICIEAFEARAWVLESQGKGPTKKK
jgi:hypothetical protein